ncbi:MAG: OmpA family protein, partial [Calditrichaeota bacterium]
MNSSKFFLLIVVSIFASFSLLAQFKAENIGGGAGYGRTFSVTDLDGDNAGGSYFRAFLRHSFSDHFEGEIGAGIAAELEGETYQTTTHPLDVRLLYRPFIKEHWSPYLYAGVGALWYKIDQLPGNASQNIESEAWSGVIPFGLGLQFKVGDNTSLEISGGYHYAFNDELDAVLADANDGFLNFKAGLTMSGFDWNADLDGDGLTNREEKKLGTNMKLADTDGDGLVDGEEVKTYQTNPLIADSDGDQLNDKEEVLTHKTNPNQPDSDNDGLTDYQEAVTYSTNPLRADTDEDGLTDKDELMTYKSDPLARDMDNDGLSDGAEVLENKTDFAKADTDGDNLNDGDEVMKYGTNPLMADSDQGTVNDGEEVARGTNPLSKDDDVVLEVKEVGSKIVLDGISFETGKAEITPQSEEVLKKALATLKAYPEMVVEIRGYTDNTGNRNFNYTLSQRRAEAVKQYLIQHGVEGSRIVAKGYGPENPIATNSTREGRAKNRRIEFVR